jgi:cell division protein FtsL
MSTGEKVLILIVAITLAAVLVPAIYVWLRNGRTKRRANQTNDRINRLK